MIIETSVSITDIPRETVEMCSAAGRDATGYVEAALRDLDVSFSKPDTVRACLRGYGAWEAEELSDDDENAARMFWLICCNFSEYLNEADRIEHDPYAEDRPEDFEPNAGSDVFFIE